VTDQMPYPAAPDPRESWGSAEDRANACGRRASYLVRAGKTDEAAVMAMLAVEARLECVEHAVAEAGM
jgi:hypothetical protein